MTELRLVENETEDGPFSAGTPLPRRLPPGRHGIPANLVVEHQRRRLIAAMAEALAEHGYANVTTTQVSEARQRLDQHLLQALRQSLGLRCSPLTSRQPTGSARRSRRPAPTVTRDPSRFPSASTPPSPSSPPSPPWRSCSAPRRPLRQPRSGPPAACSSHAWPRCCAAAEDRTTPRPSRRASTSG